MSGLEQDIEVKKWENELKKGNNLTKFLYLHLAPKEFKIYNGRKLCLDVDNLKLSVKIFVMSNNSKKGTRVIT